MFSAVFNVVSVFQSGINYHEAD